jgi:large subunit ribosomal protein L3
MDKEEKSEKQQAKDESLPAINGILGRKIGMTQLFLEDGVIVPVTVLQAGPCVVVQKKTAGEDGYAAVQLGLVEPVPKKRVTKPLQGHFKKAGVPPLRFIREFPVADETAAPEPGSHIAVNMFAEGEMVDVTGVSKGKGFQGVVRRHHFRGGGAAHGSMFHRAPGSIGASSYPSRVVKGMRAAGHMGARTTTVKNLRVERIDPEKNAMLVRGAVPGHRGTYLVIRRTKRPRKPVAAKPEAGGR